MTRDEQIGQRIIDAIVSGSLCRSECPDAPESSVVTVWSHNAAEQIGRLAGENAKTVESAISIDRSDEEQAALGKAVEAGASHGYGNTITVLKWAWAVRLSDKGLDAKTAIRHAGIDLDGYVERDPLRLLQGWRDELASYRSH